MIGLAQMAWELACQRVVFAIEVSDEQWFICSSDWRSEYRAIISRLERGFSA